MTRPCPGPGVPTAPGFALPPGACDTHLHVLGPFDAYPLAEHRPYTPPEAALPRLRALLDTMGIDRVVVAHPVGAGRDIAVTLDAIAALGHRARGTTFIGEDETEADLAGLHQAGIRGARLSPDLGVRPEPGAILRLARRIAPFGWHLAIWPENLAELRMLQGLIDDLPVPLVLDHLAARCWRPEDGLDGPGFATVCAMLGTGRVWLKLSAMCRAVTEPAPWPSLIPFGAALVQRFPERLLWASDWPHVGLWDGVMPRSGELLDWLPHIGADPAARQRILVDNPAALFGFGHEEAAA